MAHITFPDDVRCPQCSSMSQGKNCNPMLVLLTVQTSASISLKPQHCPFTVSFFPKHSFLFSPYTVSFFCLTWFPFFSLHNFLFSLYTVSFFLLTRFPFFSLHRFLFSAVKVNLTSVQKETNKQTNPEHYLRTVQAVGGSLYIKNYLYLFIRIIHKVSPKTPVCILKEERHVQTF